MKSQPSQSTISMWIILFAILFLIFVMAYVKQHLLTLPPRNNISRVNNRVINACKSHSAKVKCSKEGLSVIVLYTHPNYLSINRYVVGELGPNSHSI
jgi:hypothetical protein